MAHNASLCGPLPGPLGHLRFLLDDGAPAPARMVGHLDGKRYLRLGYFCSFSFVGVNDKDRRNPTPRIVREQGGFTCQPFQDLSEDRFGGF